ncbi:MAG: Smr/MutS family protein [Cyclobacteriaceae bacterium]
MIYPDSFESRIGFDQIRALLKGHCLSELGVQRVDQLAFDNRPAEVRTRLIQNEEFRQLIERGEPYPSQHYFDPSDIFSRASLEGNFLEAPECAALAAAIRTIQSWRLLLNRLREQYPALHALSEPVQTSKELADVISSKIDENGVIRDHASPELLQIRRKLLDEQSRVRRLVDQVFRSASAAGYVPEGLSPSIRDGRMVIPLLSEHKRRLRGFIIDESSSGQTVFVEPAEVMEANNDIRELQLKDRREQIRILTELTSRIRVELPSLRTAFDFLAEMDLARARARLSGQIGGRLPHLSDQPAMEWRAARHPLLALALKGKREVVPLNLRLDASNHFLLVSGPNAGGKSVCLKTVGLLQYMLQCGLLPPVDPDSSMGLFDSIMLDIGDQQSIENDLSTYSSHLRNMAFFVKHAGPRSLVLLDELGAGTDPNFGGGIAEAILEQLVARRTWGVATTHYYNLKAFASSRQGIINGAMKFDTVKLQPLFMLEVGQPGSSFAMEIARKTGLPGEVLSRASDIIGKDLIGLEGLIKKVNEDRQHAETERRKATALRQETDAMRAEYEALKDELDRRRKEIIEKARLEAATLLRDTNREIEKTIRHIRENKAEKKETRKVRDGLKEITDRVKPRQESMSGKPDRTLALHDKVRIRGQETTGTIMAIREGAAEVQFGDLRTTIRLDRLVRSDQAEQVGGALTRRTSGINVYEKRAHFNPLLDVRGKRAEEVIALLEQFMDDAVLLGQHEVRILHGKGEGVLRKVIREQLKKTAAVASVADEHIERGGDGITVVVLK